MNIIFELCAEDRARLDLLTEALIARAAQVECILAEREADEDEPTQAPEITPKSAEILTQEATPTATPAKTETPKTTPKSKPAEASAPTVTLEQIQQKVVQLAAGQNGAKKAKVREIINAYGAKVSDLKEVPDKWAEVWDKLTALEQE